jgi:UDP-galactose transporter B1
VEPFDLMYNIQLGKAVISFCCLVATNGVQDFLHTLQQGGFTLVVLGLTGAVGQVRCGAVRSLDCGVECDLT